MSFKDEVELLCDSRAAIYTLNPFHSCRAAKEVKMKEKEALKEQQKIAREMEKEQKRLEKEEEKRRFQQVSYCIGRCLFECNVCHVYDSIKSVSTFPSFAGKGKGKERENVIRVK